MDQLNRKAPAPRTRGSAPHAQQTRPKVKFHKKIARAHFRRVAPAPQQALKSPSFPMPGGTWPDYNNQFSDTTAKKNAGGFNGTTWNRPQ
jgi:hypothetical protein